jgi:hypothetical protein
LRLNVVLVNIVMQQVKLQLILVFGVSFEACGVHASAPFRDKMVAVAVYEKVTQASLVCFYNILDAKFWIIALVGGSP